MASKKTAATVIALVLAAGVIAALAYGAFGGGGEMKTIPMSEALARIDGGEKAVLLDVRTPEENAEGRLPDSLLLTLDVAGGFGDKVEELIPDKNARIFVYCRSGNRSRTAASIMAELGYSDVYNIGGMNDVPGDRVER